MPSTPAARSVVVTGASTGIGYGAVKVLIQQGLRVFGSVRTPGDAERLTREFGTEQFSPLVFDVTDEAAVRAASASVSATLGTEPLFGLVNNAGMGVPGPLLYLPVEGFRRQLEVNVTGHLIVTQAFAPLLMGARPGRIVMISSVGGRNATPFMGAY